MVALLPSMPLPQAMAVTVAMLAPQVPQLVPVSLAVPVALVAR